MQIEPINLSTLNCFYCNFMVVKHKCKLHLKVGFVTVCLCDICVKKDETELRMKFAGPESKTVKEAAKYLKISVTQIHQFIYSGRLAARKKGRDLLIKTSDLEAFALVERKSGRPMNQK